MASYSDVEQALVTMIANALVVPPAGGGAASAVNTIGVPTIVFRGWPNALQLDADLTANRMQISVFSGDGRAKDTTRFPLLWQVVEHPAPSLTVATAGNVATFGGDSSSPILNAALASPAGVWTYSVKHGADTPADVAAYFAGAIPGAVATGPQVMVPSLEGAIIGGSGTSAMEIGRQTRVFTITVWAPSVEARDKAGAAIDVLLRQNYRFTAADGISGCMSSYMGDKETDALQKVKCYRRDIMYTVEYPTLQTRVDADLIVFNLALTVLPANITTTYERISQ